MEKKKNFGGKKKSKYFGYETGSDGGAPCAEHEAAQFPIIFVQFHADWALHLDFNQAAGLFGQTTRLFPHHLAAALVNLSDQLADSPRLGNRLVMENHLAPQASITIMNDAAKFKARLGISYRVSFSDGDIDVEDDNPGFNSGGDSD